MFALPSQLHGLPESAEACFVPVVKPQVTPQFFFASGLSLPGLTVMLEPISVGIAQSPRAARANFVLSGIQHGFHIGFDASAVTLRCPSSNMRSAAEHSSVTDS